MTDNDIISEFIKEHPDKILTVSYPSEIHDWIKATSDMMFINGQHYYRVMNQWQKIISRPS